MYVYIYVMSIITLIDRLWERSRLAWQRFDLAVVGRYIDCNVFNDIYLNDWHTYTQYYRIAATAAAQFRKFKRKRNCAWFNVCITYDIVACTAVHYQSVRNRVNRLEITTASYMCVYIYEYIYIYAARSQGISRLIHKIRPSQRSWFTRAIPSRFLERNEIMNRLRTSNFQNTCRTDAPL